MKHYIFIIILILKFITIRSYSITDCQGTSAISPYSCWKIDTKCCYLVSDKTSKCDIIEDTTTTITTSDDIVYKVHCKLKEPSVGEINSACLQTGLPPDSYKDCFKLSTATSSCCYFKYKEQKGCFYVGSRETGEKIWNNMQIMCNAAYIGYGKLSIIAILLLLGIIF